MDNVDDVICYSIKYSARRHYDFPINRDFKLFYKFSTLWMTAEVQNGRYLHCPNGSHLSQYDDQKTYISGVVKFLKDVDTGEF